MTTGDYSGKPSGPKPQSLPGLLPLMFCCTAPFEKVLMWPCVVKPAVVVYAGITCESRLLIQAGFAVKASVGRGQKGFVTQGDKLY